MSIKAPDSVRQWKNTQPINSASNDFTNDKGVRISLPCYIDLPMTERKNILSALRAKAASTVSSTPSTMSGLVVESASRSLSDIETYIGMTIEVLRGVIFQRGGMEVSLILRLQEVTGLELISAKDFTAAFKERQDLVKGYIKNNPYQQ